MSERRKIVVQTDMGPEIITGPNVAQETSARHLLVIKEDQPEHIVREFKPGTWQSVTTEDDGS